MTVLSDSTTKSLFDLSEFAGRQDTWRRRSIELAFRKAYYDGTIYRNVRDRFQALGRLSPMLGPRLYRGTKALYLMLSRAVHVDAGIVPGGWALPEGSPAAWGTAIKQAFAWSDWARDGVLFTHFGAQYGLATLKVADLRERRRVVIKPIDPSCCLVERAGMYDPTPQLAMIVERRRRADGTAFEYGEVITADWIRTFADGEPEGFDGRPPEYPNELQFVPVVEVEHLRTGDEFGECTFQQVVPLIDEVNELASYLADIIKKHAEAQWIVMGGEASDLVKSGDNVWFMPAGADAKALVAGIDIPGVLDFIRAIRDEVHGGLPELAFDELKSKTQIATATLELQLMELVLKIKRTRPNYDHGLADALRLAGRAGAQLGIQELAVLDDEGLGFDPERAVLPLDKETALRLEQQAVSLDQQRAIAAQPESAARPIGRTQVTDEEDQDA